MPTIRVLAFVLLALLASEIPLKAYADPGGGLLMWQLLVATFLGAIYQARKAVAWIRKRK